MNTLTPEKDRLQELQSEKEFLLRSLDDLEKEFAAGDIDSDHFERLRSDYTARCANIIRELRGESRAQPKRVTKRRSLIFIGLVVLTIASGAALVSAVGHRSSGQQVTGKNVAPSRKELERAVKLTPGDFDARMKLARELLTEQNYAGELNQFDAAAKLDASDGESRAYGAWIVYLANLPDEALTRLDAASAADPVYPDTHFFRGMVLFHGKNNPTAAIPEFQQYLGAVPTSPLADQVRSELTQAQAAKAP